MAIIQNEKEQLKIMLDAMSDAEVFELTASWGIKGYT